MSSTRTTRSRLGAALLALIVVGLALAGCAREVVVESDSTTATVKRGENLVIDFGTINSSVGDDWILVTKPDPAVLGSATTDSSYNGDPGATGGSNTLRFTFNAVDEGTTVVEFEYRFRGEADSPDTASDQQRSAKITVTVT